ncbi:MAG: hypothetical protein A3J46_03805 [Candidatus Yanofskybacteria bacterium RIFCSPHIGHO2_02_FULL_41_11]|uniref:Cytochrome C biogenesis protein transmembrane domain-containing protein n=1 Tax=Candidatus Yanofskybacteria bacterium RIFCSPHIGHO2_02_FULL_41_11 TaxID=1802675 RepID=A0A1F8F7K8_9BACT|nr:MAG: hypothetical protein A3J46_03805 [Candidatus Yanofskybacteria bacterium RIFCSPHIGHO2_02_FULL_41_11]
MPEFNIGLTISSFIAGIFTFFAPCTLPLVPAFLGIISGVKGSGSLSAGDLTLYRWRIFRNAIFYVLGFSLVFILFGVSFTFLTQALGLKDWLQRIGGVFIVLFGLMLMGWLQFPFLSQGRQIRASQVFNSASLINSFFLGALFALGWSPCVGPLLGSVLLLASTTGTVIEGTFLLVVFTIGLGLPFLLTALLIGKAFSTFRSASSSAQWGKMLEAINKIAGIFLIFLGVLLAVGRFTAFHNQLIIYFYRYQFFEVFINRFL